MFLELRGSDGLSQRAESSPTNERTEMHERASLVHKDECMERLTISSQYLARTAVNDLVHFKFSK